ncbi:MAG: right-handed parallel beta-helix repeat-containing protein [Chloroflexota bacterium]
MPTTVNRTTAIVAIILAFAILVLVAAQFVLHPIQAANISGPTLTETPTSNILVVEGTSSRPTTGSARTFYVSKTGNNTAATSWNTAWNELNQINWPSLRPGDTILIDGGSKQMIYTTPLVVAKSGSSTAPITIKLASEVGRDGQAVIYGGRSTPLPYCDQPSYFYQTSGVNKIGVDLGSNSWVVIDGTKWSGFLIHGNNQSGISLGSSSSNNFIRNVEVTDNGKAYRDGDHWNPDLPGVSLSGSQNIFERDLIHDNGQDAFQSSGGISNFTVRQSWLYNSRPHPSNPALAYNYCRHSDGIQIYNGGVQSGVTIDSAILGPGLMQGTILGQALSAGQSAQIDNVMFNNVLILDTTNANIMGYPTVQSRNWTIQHVTSFHVLYDPDGQEHSTIFLEGSGHQIKDSIFVGGNNYLPDRARTSGNFQYKLSGFALGRNADPLFVHAPAYSSQPSIQDLINGDYTPAPDSPAAGKGSNLTSVAQLLALQPEYDSHGTAAPAPTVTGPTNTAR